MPPLITVSPFSFRKWEWSISQGSHEAEIYTEVRASVSWGRHSGHDEVLRGDPSPRKSLSSPELPPRRAHTDLALAGVEPVAGRGESRGGDP